MNRGGNHGSLFSLNLNLIPVLVELLTTRSVSKTAARLGKTQPVVSRALADIRIIVGDPLLVRSTNGMRLTERGEAIAATLPLLTEQLSDLLQAPQPFSPELEKAQFRIATADYVAAILAPPLTKYCARWHPNISFDFTQVVDCC